MRSVLRVLRVQVRASLLLSMQYRLEFVLDAVMTLFFTVTAVVPLVVLYRHRGTVAGWGWGEALVVVGWFTVLKGVLSACIQPSLQGVTDQIRTGKLDFLLLKPADAQLLVSTARFDFWKGANVAAGVVLLVHGLRAAHHVPSSTAILAAMLVFLCAVAILYSMWILVVCLAFWVVKVDNLSWLLVSLYDAARWPSSVYRGALAIIFTFVLPLAVMTTFPALALLDRITGAQVGGAALGAFAFLAISRAAWRRALAHYTSAGG